jgi:hypothetical protein
LDNLEPGTYSFYAKAYDNDGAIWISNKITITVKSIEEINQPPSIEGVSDKYTVFLWEDFSITFQVKDDGINEGDVNVSTYIIRPDGEDIEVNEYLTNNNGEYNLNIPAEVLYEILGGEWEATLKIVADDGISKPTEKTAKINVEYPAEWIQAEIVADEIWDWTPGKVLTTNGQQINLYDYLTLKEQVNEDIYFEIVKIEPVDNDIAQRKSFTIEDGIIKRTWENVAVSEVTCLDPDGECSIDESSVYKLYIQAFIDKDWNKIPVSSYLIIKVSIDNS